MVPPEGIAEVGVKAREMGTLDLPTILSKEAMFKETEETRDIMPPDDTVFETEHTLARNVTLSDPAVAAPIVTLLFLNLRSVPVTLRYLEGAAAPVPRNTSSASPRRDSGREGV